MYRLQKLYRTYTHFYTLLHITCTILFMYTCYCLLLHTCIPVTYTLYRKGVHTCNMHMNMHCHGIHYVVYLLAYGLRYYCTHPCVTHLSVVGITCMSLRYRAIKIKKRYAHIHAYTKHAYVSIL